MQKDQVKSFIEQLELKAGRQLKVRNGYDIENMARILFDMEADVEDEEFAAYAEKSKEPDFSLPKEIERHLYFHTEDPELWLDDIFAFAKFLGLENFEHDADPAIPRFKLKICNINGRLALKWFEFPEKW